MPCLASSVTRELRVAVFIIKAHPFAGGKHSTRASIAIPCISIHIL